MLRSARECFVLSLVFLYVKFQHNVETLINSFNFLQVIAKFLALMYSYLNISMSKNIVPDGIKGREIHHSFPMTLFQVCLYLCMVFSISICVFTLKVKALSLLFWQPHVVRLDHHTLKLLKYWTWQFVVIRPLCSTLMISLQLIGFYPSWLSWTFTIIVNFSVSLALYSLVIFYHVFAKELAPHNPLAKFLCIKGIVFFVFWQVMFCIPQSKKLIFGFKSSKSLRQIFIRLFWFWKLQGIALDILVAMGVIKSHHFWLEVEQIQEAIQNVLVCLEMVIFAAVQKHAYDAGPYSGETKKKLDKKTEWSSLG